MTMYVAPKRTRIEESNSQWKYVSKQRERRRAEVDKLHLELSSNIRPMTNAQDKVFKCEKNLVLHGSAGTGKSFISSYLAYDDIINRKRYAQLIYIRSAVPTRNIGFLPGTESEKVKVYEAPYQDIATELFNRGDAYEMLKKKEIVHFMTTSHVRGITLRDSVIIVDECQNMSYHELDSIVTRIGEGCRIFFCGDFHQSDLKDNGIKKFYNVLKSMEEFDFVNFTVDDIVRSELVKSYLKAKYKEFGYESDSQQPDLSGGDSGIQQLLKRRADVSNTSVQRSSESYSYT